MLKVKELLKTKDAKIGRRKIKLYNILNGTNYTMRDYGIFDYDGILNYYGVLLDEIDYSKLDEYKRNYYILKRWILWILNNCKKKEDKNNYPNKIFFFYKNKFILKQDLKNKYFWVSETKIWSKIESKFDYNYFITRNLLDGVLEEHFKCKEFITGSLLLRNQ